MTSKDHTILVVDDEIEFLNSMKNIIEDLGFKVVTAKDGLEGLENLKNNQPVSVILSDHKMPKIEGNTFLKMAKEISPQSQRVMITAVRDPVMMGESINEGEVLRFLHKPVNIEDVENIVKVGVKRFEELLHEIEESKKKEKTIHALMHRLHNKPGYEKGFILSLFLALGIIVYFLFSQNSPPEQKAKSNSVNPFSDTTAKRLDECIETAQEEFLICTSNIKELEKTDNFSQSKINRSQASCEAIHLQKKTICESRFRP